MVNPLQSLSLFALLAGSQLLTGCSALPSTELSSGADQQTQVGQVSMHWQQVADYTDIQSTTSIQHKFERHLFHTLNKELSKLASPLLGDTYQLKLKITNVDLAGDVKPTFTSTDDIRIVSELYPPRFEFSYQLLNNQQVIKQGHEKLKDMGFLFGITPVGSKSFAYEQRLLAEWFNDTIKPTLLGRE